jgi:hypothetical protein
MYTQAMADFLNERIGQDLIISFHDFRMYFNLNAEEAYRLYQYWYNSEKAINTIK